uniref:Uncharacterized protein n=1 Tax=Oryza nivara TaxID=4536 RepID=A0A0E0G557_ORYNI
MEEAGERDADETRAWSGTASPAALWKTVASAAAMLKLALAMISAAFRTTPFSMSMQLCPNATMSLHSPSIFDVVSSITPIVGGGEGRGDDAAVASPLVAFGHDAASPEHGHMGMRSWRKTAGLP